MLDLAPPNWAQTSARKDVRALLAANSSATSRSTPADGIGRLLRVWRTRRVERIHRYGILREDRRGMKESAVMLSAVEAVAHADAVWPSQRDDADAAAQAAAGEALGSFHAHPALRRKWSACTPDLNRCVDRSSRCRARDRP